MFLGSLTFLPEMFRLFIYLLFTFWGLVSDLQQGSFCTNVGFLLIQGSRGRMGSALELCGHLDSGLPVWGIGHAGLCLLGRLLSAIVLCTLGKGTPLLGWAQLHAKAHGSGSQARDGWLSAPSSLQGQTSLSRAQPAQGGATSWLWGQGKLA